MRILSSSRRRLVPLSKILALGAASLVAGCSSDVSRFDLPAFGLTSTEATSRPLSPQPVYQSPPPATSGYSQQQSAPDYTGYGAAPSYGGSAVGESGYPSYRSTTGTQYKWSETSPDAATLARRQGVQPAALPDAAGLGPEHGFLGKSAGTAVASTGKRTGDRYVVGEGDSLYKIARDNGVSMSELMKHNRLSSPQVTPGQELKLPKANTWRSQKGKKEREAAIALQGAPVEIPTPPAAEAETEPAVAGTTHTIRGGESLYAIARKYGVKADALAAANGIDDPAKVKQGQVLRIPVGGEMFADAAVSDAPRREAAVAPSDVVTDIPAAGPEDADVPVASDADVSPEAADGEGSFAAIKPPTAAAPSASNADEASADEDAATPATAAGADKMLFRWPVRGRVVGKYGRQSDGSNNDGINLAVPLGTDVHAAEDGVVAYAGDELKGYGRLVLIRHTGNWVTAYAHNETLLVKRGDQIRRGQVVAKAGKTGAVDQPQVHFELRQGSQPVDPLPHMASN